MADGFLSIVGYLQTILGVPCLIATALSLFKHALTLEIQSHLPGTMENTHGKLQLAVDTQNFSSVLKQALDIFSNKQSSQSPPYGAGHLSSQSGSYTFVTWSILP